MKLITIIKRFSFSVILFIFVIMILTCSQSSRISSPKNLTKHSNRVSLFGIDGATFFVMVPLNKMGYTPVLRYLMKTGAYSECKTIHPTLSPVIWTSIITGRAPTYHGIYNFIRPKAGTDKFLPYTSNDRNVPALWEIASRNNIKGVYVNWLVSWPVDNVLGVMIGDKVSHGLKRMGYPKSVQLTLEKTVSKWETKRSKRKKNHNRYRKRRLKLNPMNRMKSTVGFVKPLLINAFVSFLREEFIKYEQEVKPSLSTLYINNIDPVEHLSWYGMDAETNSAHHKKRKIDSAREIIKIYNNVDKTLGTILARDTIQRDIIIVSDHGMESRAKVTANYSIKDINPDRLLNVIGLLVVNDDTGKINWNKTILSSMKFDSYTGIIYYLINSNYKSSEFSTNKNKVDNLKKILLEIHEKKSKKRLFNSIILQPKNIIKATLNQFNDSKHEFISYGNSFTLAQILKPHHFPPGFHHNAPSGIIILNGRNFRSGRFFPAPSIFDIFPTIAELIGIPISRELEGKAIERVFINSIPKKFISSYGTRKDLGQNKSLTNKQKVASDNTLRKLRQLGYIE